MSYTEYTDIGEFIDAIKAARRERLYNAIRVVVTLACFAGIGVMLAWRG